MWTFLGNPVESHDDLHPECTDFVYRVTFEDGRMYVGKKAVRAKRKRPPLKGKKRCRRVMTDLPFVNYQGSSDEVKDLTPVKKEILYQCRARKAATYLEADYLFDEKALFRDDYINGNIGGTYYSTALDGLINDDECIAHIRGNPEDHDGMGRPWP